jgi:regulator of protease activity HflC (stomatin/prohibitin superfamily)
MRWIGLLPSLLVVLIAILSSFRIVRFGHRIVVFRFGRRVDIRRPGIRWVIPLVDRQVDIDLDKEIPGWGTLAEKRLEARIIEVVENRSGKGDCGSPPAP